MHPQTKARLFALAAFPLLLLNIGQARAQTGSRPQMGTVAVSGQLTIMPHISISEMGRGSPVMLIPGLSSPRQVWAAVAPQIARGHRVILVQVNGFGGDDPGDNLKPALLNGIVADLHTYAATQKLPKVDVIGHSMGGLVTLMWAKAYPGDVRRAMIVDALPFIGTIFVPGATVPMLAPQAAAMRDAMAAQYGKPADPAAAARIAEGQALTPAARAEVAKWVAKADPRVSAAAFYEDMTTDLRPDMAAIATPITLLFPYSAALPRERAEPVYRAGYAGAPHVAFVPVADSGHFIMLDQPAVFAGAVADFLR